MVHICTMNNLSSVKLKFSCRTRENVPCLQVVYGYFIPGDKKSFDIVQLHTILMLFLLILQGP